MNRQRFVPMFLSLVVLFDTQQCLGQGLRPTPLADYQNIPVYTPGTVVVVREVGGQRFLEQKQIPLLPLPNSVDLSQYLPTPGLQQHNDCVGWAFARGVYSYQLGLHRHRKPSKDHDVFSPLFIYSQIAIRNPPATGGNGSYIWHSSEPNAVDLVLSRGCASEETMPYDSSTNGWQAPPSQLAFDEAKNFPAFFHSRLSDLESIRRAVVQNCPVVLGIQVDNKFFDAADTSIYRWSGNSGQLGHAVVVVGYDNGKQAVRLMNSYGPNWKDNGFCWAAYDQFNSIGNGNWCYEAHMIQVVDENLPQFVSTSNRNFVLNSDQRVYENGTAISGSDQTREITATKDWLYALRTDGRVFTYALNTQTNQNFWDNLTDASPAAGLGGQLTNMIASNDSFLYALTNSGRIYARVPTSSGSQRRWERIDLPSNQRAIDLRFRDGFIRGTSEDGRVYRREPGNWLLN